MSKLHSMDVRCCQAPAQYLAILTKEVKVALLVGAMPRKKGMLRSELLQKNAGIFKAQGKALNE